MDQAAAALANFDAMAQQLNALDSKPNFGGIDLPANLPPIQPPVQPPMQPPAQEPFSQPLYQP